MQKNLALRRVSTRLLATLALVAGATALALAPASTAAAHDELVGSDPAPGSTVTSPLHMVKLTFSDAVLDLSGDGTSSIVQVTGPDGGNRHFETGCAKATGRVVTAPVALGAPGSYEVEWQVTSADGHTVSQKLDFSYRPPEGAPRAKGSAARPTCKAGAAAGAAGTGSTAPAPAGTGHGAPSDLGIVIGLASGVVGLAVIAVVVVLLTARRGTNGAPRWQPDKD